MAFLRIILAGIAAAIGFVCLLPVFLLVLPFWLVTVFTRLISRLLEPQFLTRDQLIQFDPMFGWRARPNLDTHHLMVDLFHIKTDPEGWRGKNNLDQSDIVVFGDSFAAGYGVSERHFFANVRATPRIKAVGIGGYSMVQELLWMKQLAPRLRSKQIVWFVYLGNDLYDNLVPDLRGYRKPFVRQVRGNGDWEIVSFHVNAQKWPIITEGRMEGQHFLVKLAELCSDTFLANRAYAACEYLIAAGRLVCDEAGAQLTVITVPDPCQLHLQGQKELEARGGDPGSFDPKLPDKKLKAICSNLGVEFLAGGDFLDSSCYKTNDCHWNEKGHRKVAERLTHLYEERRSNSSARSSTISDALAQV